MASESYPCPRCGEPFPTGQDVDEAADWAVIEDGAEVVCPGCATPVDRLGEELEALGVR